jgi:hypothetical protein
MNSQYTQHQHPSGAWSRSHRRSRVVAFAALVATLSLAICSAAAVAASSTASSIPAGVKSALAHVGTRSLVETASPYGEVSRFGGFVEGGAPGKFDTPVGFAVDPKDSSTSDHNAVYVLDRVVLKEAEHLGYRLQKLSSTGTLLASATLPVQSFGAFGEAHPMFGLAVDSAKHRVYALVEGLVEVEPGSEKYVTAAHSLVAWSTEPKKIGGEERLVPAPGYAETEPLTGAALVAGPAALQPGVNQDLVVPEGLTVNSSTHEVVIAAQQGLENEEVFGGPTTLQSVITEGAHSGTRGAAWTANGTIAPNDERAAGVFTTTSGAFGIDLYHGHSRISRLAQVNSALTEATMFAEDKSNEMNIDEAPSLDARKTPNRNGGFNSSTLEVYAAGSPITQLSSGLYAARFGTPYAEQTDFQSLVAPWNGVPFFWTENNNANVANMGVRLFTSSGTVITTIGGQPQGQGCNIGTEQMSVAAGASGSVFVLTQPNEANGNSNDEVIEFAPGGSKGACPQPSGTLTVNGQSGSSFSFPVNTEVTLADTVERKGEAPYRFDWVLLNEHLEVDDLFNQMQAPGYLWPAPSTTHQFTKKGTYYLAATVYGDYGLTIVKPEVVTITIH